MSCLCNRIFKRYGWQSRQESRLIAPFACRLDIIIYIICTLHACNMKDSIEIFTISEYTGSERDALVQKVYGNVYEVTFVYNARYIVLKPSRRCSNTVAACYIVLKPSRRCSNTVAACYIVLTLDRRCSSDIIQN